MKKIFIFILLCSFNLFSQTDLKQVLNKYNKETIPYIFAHNLHTISNDVILLDAREQKEFDISHLKNAIHVGYKKFELKNTMAHVPNKNTRIIVYCSLGVRSEDIGEKLKHAGYTNVLNLYGGIFEWKNNNYKVFNSLNQETNKVHAYSLEWGKWLVKGEKIYD